MLLVYPGTSLIMTEVYHSWARACLGLFDKEVAGEPVHIRISAIRQTIVPLSRIASLT